MADSPSAELLIGSEGAPDAAKHRRSKSERKAERYQRKVALQKEARRRKRIERKSRKNQQPGTQLLLKDKKAQDTNVMLYDLSVICHSDAVNNADVKTEVHFAEVNTLHNDMQAKAYDNWNHSIQATMTRDLAMDKVVTARVIDVDVAENPCHKRARLEVSRDSFVEHTNDASRIMGSSSPCETHTEFITASLYNTPPRRKTSSLDSHCAVGTPCDIVESVTHSPTLVLPCSQASNFSLGPSVETEAIHVSKRVKQAAIKKRLADALQCGQRVCIDMGMGALMSAKEQSRLAQQLCRLYGANRRAVRPMHIYLTSIDRDGPLFRECVRKNSGFERYQVEFCERTHQEMFAPSELVYLTPDSPEVLRLVDPTSVYVIGGLVDETIQKNATLQRAIAENIRTARLPIDEFMTRSQVGGTYSHALAVNQVFEILLEFCANGGDWCKALVAVLPSRSGFVPRSQPT